VIFTFAVLIPNGKPGCVEPSMIIFEFRDGSSDKRVIVLSDKVFPARLKVIVSITAVPFDLAFITASRKVPGPASALDVTIKVSATAVRQLHRATRRSDRSLFKRIWVQEVRPKNRVRR